jgi:hypothetical protein
MSKNVILLHAIDSFQFKRHRKFPKNFSCSKNKNRNGFPFAFRVIEVSSTMTERNYADVCSYSEPSLVLSHRSALAPRFPASLPSYEEEFISQDAPVPAHWKKENIYVLTPKAVKIVSINVIRCNKMVVVLLFWGIDKSDDRSAT